MFQSIMRGLVLGILLAGSIEVAAQENQMLPVAQQAGPNYDHHKLVRVNLKSQRESDLILALGGQAWDCITGVGPMNFSLSPEAFQAIGRSGLEHQVLIDDIGPLVQADMARMRQVPAEGGIAGANWFSDFKTYPQVNSYIDDLVVLRPDLAQKLTIGATLEGRTIYGLRITGPGDSSGRPAVIFSGCQHAREWIAVMVPMYIADALVRQYDTDPQIQSLLDRVEFFIVPIVNPDGYEYTYAVGGDRLWRKNRRDNGGGSFGVDLNRNWSVDWGGPHSTSTNPNSLTYIGTEAFSELETQALRDFITARPQIVAHIDFHSYGQIVLQNWAHTNAETPDACLIDTIGADMNQDIYAINAMIYENGWGQSLLYLASGVFPDWCYGERGILGYTIELRDNGQTGFILPPQQIIPTGQEALPAALRLADRATRSAEFFFPRALPAVLAAGAIMPVTLKIQSLGTSQLRTNTARLFARLGASGPFTEYVMSTVDGVEYQASLPHAPCGSIVQYYFRIELDNGRAITSPPDAPTNVHQAGAANIILNYTFQTNSGWTVQNGGASSGQWQRGVPVNDPDWPYDPHTDADSSGQCYLTQNQSGSSDVDNGSVRLISPALDLASVPKNVLIGYSYYLQLVTPGGSDPMVIELSANDLAGPWIELARHDTTTSLQWRSSAIHARDIASRGIGLTSQMRLRFTVTDGDPQSIVEAGVDGVLIASDCGGPPTECLADIDQNDQVNVDDLLAVINAWGPCNPPPENCSADIAPSGGNGLVDVDDLLAVIDAWGDCR